MHDRADRLATTAPGPPVHSAAACEQPQPCCRWVEQGQPASHRPKEGPPAARRHSVSTRPARCLACNQARLVKGHRCRAARWPERSRRGLAAPGRRLSSLGSSRLRALSCPCASIASQAPAACAASQRLGQLLPRRPGPRARPGAALRVCRAWPGGSAAAARTCGIVVTCVWPQVRPARGRAY